MVARVGARAALVQVDFAGVDGVRQVAADPQRPVVLAERQAGASSRTIVDPLDGCCITVVAAHRREIDPGPSFSAPPGAQGIVLTAAAACVPPGDLRHLLHLAVACGRIVGGAPNVVVRTVLPHE